ncbi:hypothetical protein A3K64_02645 [Candidatus Micrarchaeota archaeon RBG_16_36_9]|nr:MAG: hypothetical protein A3K64_02645 [Candidatus Micrarchaeota archaeon RBG_16_36_9]
MKGQYLTVEYIMFFLIGITLVISVYYIFSNISNIAEERTVNSQINAVGETLRGTIINMFEIVSSTNSEVNYNISIPVKLSRCIYTIEVLGNNLNLNCLNSQIGTSLSLYNLNITAKNIIYSTNGYVEISAKNGMVELG